MSDTAALLARFYEAFAHGDAAGMATCYHRSARFEDPAFGPLDRDRACAMWAMLVGRATDLAVTYRVVEADDRSGRVDWEAHYTFTRTGRPVVNRVQATFTLKDGLILTHRDAFGFWTWSRQALGLPGWLLGWTPLLRSKVRAEALRGLAAYRAKLTPR